MVCNNFSCTVHAIVYAMLLFILALYVLYYVHVMQHSTAACVQVVDCDVHSQSKSFAYMLRQRL